MCVTFVTCEERVCGPRCHSGSSLYIYRVYLLACLLTYLLSQAEIDEILAGRERRISLGTLSLR